MSLKLVLAVEEALLQAELQAPAAVMRQLRSGSESGHDQRAPLSSLQSEEPAGQRSQESEVHRFARSTKELGANGEPLYLDVKDAYYDVEDRPLIVGGRYGLGSHDTTPAQIISVFNNLSMPEPKKNIQGILNKIIQIFIFYFYL